MHASWWIALFRIFVFNWDRDVLSRTSFIRFYDIIQFYDELLIKFVMRAKMAYLLCQNAIILHFGGLILKQLNLLF